MRASQNKARELQALHLGPSPLLLPNAWDMSSARIFENVGFRAVGTTSAGIAATLGVPDGEQRVSREEMLAVVARIVRAVSLLVSADIEAGYGATIAEVRETARAVIQTGAVGVNIEDGTGTPEHPLTDLALQVEKIQAFREVADASRVSLVINARTDVFWLAIGEPVDRFEMAVQRANAYRQAGAEMTPSLAMALGFLLFQNHCFFSSALRFSLILPLGSFLCHLAKLWGPPQAENPLDFSHSL